MEAKLMHPCSTLLLRILLVKILLLGVLLCLPRSLDAEEGGSGLYVPGAYSSLLNITPNKPGVAVGDAFYFYKGDLLGNSTLAFGGLLASSINANVYFEGISFAYTFPHHSRRALYRRGDNPLPLGECGSEGIDHSAAGRHRNTHEDRTRLSQWCDRYGVYLDRAELDFRRSADQPSACRVRADR